MSPRYFPSRKGPSPETLIQRQELFHLIRESHLKWMNETGDEDLREAHHAIVNLFDRLMQQYEILFDVLQNQG